MPLYDWVVHLYGVLVSCYVFRNICNETVLVDIFSPYLQVVRVDLLPYVALQNKCLEFGSGRLYAKWRRFRIVQTVALRRSARATVQLPVDSDVIRKSRVILVYHRVVDEPLNLVDREFPRLPLNVWIGDVQPMPLRSPRFGVQDLGLLDVNCHGEVVRPRWFIVPTVDVVEVASFHRNRL